MQSVACTLDYGQRLRADVICFTYHDLVFSGVSRDRVRRAVQQGQ